MKSGGRGTGTKSCVGTAGKCFQQAEAGIRAEGGRHRPGTAEAGRKKQKGRKAHAT